MTAFRHLADFTPMTLESAANDNVWLVAMVEPRSEFRVCDALSEIGVSVFLPCQTIWRKVRDQNEPARAPLMPGYLFLAFPIDQDGGYAGLHEAHAVRGLTGFIKRDGRASVVPHRLLAKISARMTAGEFDYTRDRKAARRNRREVTLTLDQFVKAGREAVLGVIEKGDFEALNDNLAA